MLQMTEQAPCPSDTFFCDWSLETVSAEEVGIDFPSIYDAEQGAEGVTFSEVCGEYRVRRHLSEPNTYLVVCQSNWALEFSSDHYLNTIFFPPMGN
tara:strand:- start:419 stop:706 length:288 start_codon:yes stop_codon:yes gene_type:complete